MDKHTHTLDKETVYTTHNTKFKKATTQRRKVGTTRFLVLHSFWGGFNTHRHKYQIIGSEQTHVCVGGDWVVLFDFFLHSSSSFSQQKLQQHKENYFGWCCLPENFCSWCIVCRDALDRWPPPRLCWVGSVWPFFPWPGRNNVACIRATMDTRTHKYTRTHSERERERERERQRERDEMWH